MNIKKKRVLATALTFAVFLSACASGTKTESTPAPETESRTEAESHTETEPAPAQEAGAYTAGTFTASAQGNNGPVTVEVTFSADKIESVTITEHSETAGISDPAIERIPEQILEHQSLAVDAIAGATNTSKAILAAVEDCATQAGADIEALKEPIQVSDSSKTEESRTADIVVVGSGIAGLSAAISAAENGAEVVLLEKMATTGGTTAIAGGYLICVESEYLAEAGIDDSLDTFITYWNERMSYSGQNSGYPDMEFATSVFAKTGETVDWLNQLGVNWDPEPTTFFGPYPVVHNPGNGRALVDEMVDIATAAGVEVIMECEAKELLTDATGAVTGLVAETADAQISFQTKAVILATGGISANEELVSKYSPKVSKAQTINTAAAGCVGDGLIMAQAVGAAAYDNFFTSINSTSIDPAFTAVTANASALTTPNQLGVNAKGERFASESPKYYDALGSDMIQDGNAPFWYIYDSENADTVAVLEEGYAAGVVAKGDTIADLADNMEVDAATLQATYDRYMELCKTGSDLDYNKSSENLVVLETAPFYGVRFFPTTFGSQGGMITDPEGRVQNTSGNTITGLYAAGADSNRSFYNENYVLAASLGIYATTGRTTGATAAADIR